MTREIKKDFWVLVPTKVESGKREVEIGIKGKYSNQIWKRGQGREIGKRKKSLKQEGINSSSLMWGKLRLTQEGESRHDRTRNRRKSRHRGKERSLLRECGRIALKKWTV